MLVFIEREKKEKKVHFNVALRPETVRTIRDGLGLAQDVHLDFHTAPELWLKELVSFQCCFTSTETIRLIGDGEPRTSTSTFTQLLSCAQVSDGTYAVSFVSVLLYVHTHTKKAY